MDTLAWRLRARGYRTVCLHPYDRTFYGRDVAMPNLGFDRFLGEEAFRDAPRLGRYVSDVIGLTTLEALRTAATVGEAACAVGPRLGAHLPLAATAVTSWTAGGTAGSTASQQHSGDGVALVLDRGRVSGIVRRDALIPANAVAP